MCILADLVLPEGPFWTALASLGAGCLTFATLGLRERREWRKASEVQSKALAEMQKREGERCEGLLTRQNSDHKEDMRQLLREQLLMQARVEQAINEQTRSLTEVLRQPLRRQNMFSRRPTPKQRKRSS